MMPPVRSLHHVTATVNDAQADLDFYVGLLGLRLVKKTVNFDNRQVYHFYYGNELGTPGTIMTTFPYKGMGVPLGRKGAGQITAIAFSVPTGSLDAWRERLADRAVRITGRGTRFGEEFIALDDPSGLVIELVATGGDDREPWISSGVDRSTAIRGIHTLSLTIKAPERSIAFLSRLLGWTAAGEEGSRTRVTLADGGPGHWLDIVGAPDTSPAMNGLGTVHHLAMAVATPEDQLAYREEILRLGVPVTEVLDRQYFQSIYFREPGGVLYEIATIPPGFLIDEEPARLGQALKLPPWEEVNRVVIEAGLPRVSHP